jgi:hypothetical protein
MKLEIYQQAFFALVKAGLWEQEARLSQYKNIDYSVIMKLAEEQSVVGLITAGLEHIIDVKVPKEELLQFVGSSLQIEQQNIAMNEYVARLIDLLCKHEIYAILVKGQGIAQCYERPLWRASGDIDLLLSDYNYEKAKEVLIPLAIDVESEYIAFKHFGMTMQSGMVVELHGTLHSRLSKRVEKIIDEAQKCVFYDGNVRSWVNGKTTVFLPSPDNDIIFVFTHILHHFYIEGIGLRQICDLCRLLWTFKDSLNYGLLESRIKKMGLMTEWKAFGAFAVEYLGMPEEAMPFYDSRFKVKSSRILDFVLECGNLGHNREFNRSGNFLIGKFQSLWFKMRDFARHARLFPIDSFKFFFHYLINGMQVAKDSNGAQKALLVRKQHCA